MMRHVPISEFKDHASELVAAAECGEDIVITRHGKPAAWLVAAPTSSDAKRRLAEEALSRLAEFRKQQRERGVSITVEEMIAWKNEGRP